MASQLGRCPTPDAFHIAQHPDDIPRAKCLVHKRTDSDLWRVSPSLYADLITATTMLLIVGTVMVLIAVVIIPRMRVPGGVNSTNLG